MIEGRLNLLARDSVLIKFASNRTSYIIIAFMGLEVKDLLTWTRFAISAR